MKIYKIYVSILTFFFFTGCIKKEIIITKDYVINPYWDKVDNSFDVIRMNVKDSNNIDIRNVSPPELLIRLEEDSSFVYRANVKYSGEEYSKRKVYFNKDNDFLWWRNLHKSSSTKKILGELKQNTWYFLGGLDKEKTLYYVYIDSFDKLHTFKVSSTSWTNY